MASASIGTLGTLQVLVVPGTGFGRAGYFRISYSVEDWVIDGALEGFAKAAEALGLRR